MLFHGQRDSSYLAQPVRVSMAIVSAHVQTYLSTALFRSAIGTDHSTIDIYAISILLQ